LATRALHVGKTTFLDLLQEHYELRIFDKPSLNAAAITALTPFFKPRLTRQE